MFGPSPLAKSGLRKAFCECEFQCGRESAPKKNVNTTGDNLYRFCQTMVSPGMLQRAPDLAADLIKAQQASPYVQPSQVCFCPHMCSTTQPFSFQKCYLNLDSLVTLVCHCQHTSPPPPVQLCTGYAQGDHCAERSSNLGRAGTPR